jgi:hypothetical protein
MMTHFLRTQLANLLPTLPADFLHTQSADLYSICALISYLLDPLRKTLSDTLFFRLLIGYVQDNKYKIL